MSAEESEQDKSEQPTPFKLTRARRKGVVARGSDLGFLTGLCAFAGYMWIAGPNLSHSIERAAHDALVASTNLADGSFAVFAVVAALFGSIVQPLLLMVATIFFFVLLFEIVQTGVVASTEPLKPDFSRLNPAKGLRRLFTFRLLIETLKNVLKLCLYTVAAYVVIRGALQTDIGAVTDGLSLSALMAHTGFRLLGAFILLAFIFAVLDQLIVRRDFLKKMRMSRRELRREAREREGEPRLKQKRKKLHAEFVKMSQSLRNMRKADVLITNPQHIAIALHYEPRNMLAPEVVSAGTNQFAQRLRRLAFIYGIPVVENKALARELYRKSGLNRSIPEHCFKPVADIYNTIRRRTGKGGANRPHVQEILREEL